MIGWLLILLLADVAFANAHYDPRCSPSTKLPCIPGLEFSGIGIDIVTGNAMFPILNLTFERNKTWTSPFSDGEVFAVPDQAHVALDPYTGSKQWTFRSEQQYADHLATSSGLGLGLPFFGMSSDMRTARSMLKGGSCSCTLTDDVVSLYQIALERPESIPLLSTFMADVALLPSRYDPLAYRNFVGTYGTHIIIRTKEGGKASWMSSVVNKYSAKYTDFVLGGNAAVEYNGFKGGIGRSFSRSGSSSAFASSSASQSSFKGGDPTRTGNWTAWIESVLLDPTAVQLALVAITSVIKNATVSRNLERFIETYYNESRLGSYSAPPETSSFLLEQCSCEQHTTFFPTGFVIVETGLDNLDGDNYLTSPATMCKPCRSWSVGGDFGSSVHSSAKLEKQGPPFHSWRRQSVILALPGVDVLGAGYDAVLGEYRPLPVIEMGPMVGRFQNPFTGQMYSYPSNIDVSQLGSGSRSTSSLYASSYEYAGNLSLSWGVGGSYCGFGGSYDVKFSEKFFFGAQSVMYNTKSETTLYSLLVMGISPNTTLMFQQAVSALPRAYSAPPYDAFVKMYGTHVITQARVGGVMDMKIGVDQEYFRSSTSSSLSTSASILFEYFRTGSFSANISRFLESSFADASFFGGDYRTLAVLGNFEHWVATLWNEPVVFQPTLSSIDLFVEDAQIRANLAHHIRNYMLSHSPSTATVPKVPFVTLLPQTTQFSGLICPFPFFTVGLGQLVQALDGTSYCIDSTSGICASVESPFGTVSIVNKVSTEGANCYSQWVESPTAYSGSSFYCSSTTEVYAVSPVLCADIAVEVEAAPSKI